MTKLLILSSDTGEGHNSAAAAIEIASRSAGFETRIRKPLEESGMVNRFLANFYNTLLAHAPHWMRWYFGLIEKTRPNERDILFSRVRTYIGRFIESEKPEILLSVHPMLNHFIQRFIKEEGLGVPCYTFVTDPFPPFWRGWASQYVDRYLVVTDEALQALTAHGVPAWRIQRVSMPVRPRFVPATMTEIREFRNRLQLDEAEIILINGGARGGGPILKIYRTVRRCAQDSNILVVCGWNSRLRRRIARFQDPKTRTFGFLEDVHRYVAASDLVITKPGALSTYEAMACKVPLLLAGISGLMPQESGLLDATSRYDFGFGVRTFDQLETIIRRGSAEWNRKRDLAAQFYVSSVGEDLVQRIHTADARA